jgi:hypothetical protein
MGNGEIDRIQVNQLMARYDLARSAVYTRMNALGITPIKIGNKAFINAAQLRQLDDLHLHIQGGGNTAEFLEMRGQGRKKESPNESTGLTTGQNDLIGVFNRMLGMFQSSAPNPLDYYEKLEQAYRNGWELKTSEIADLLDIPPSEIKQYGDRFQDAGFVFIRSGSRWRVLKR